MDFFFKGEKKPSVDGEDNCMDNVSPGLSIIKAVSEALYFGVASCLKGNGPAYQAIRQDIHPCEDNRSANTKLMISLLTGGKSAGSQVKFSRFYLIVDGYANPDVHIPTAFNKFIAAFKKNMGAIKGGETAFKVG